MRFHDSSPRPDKARARQGVRLAEPVPCGQSGRRATQLPRHEQSVTHSSAAAQHRILLQSPDDSHVQHHPVTPDNVTAPDYGAGFFRGFRHAFHHFRQVPLGPLSRHAHANGDAEGCCGDSRQVGQTGGRGTPPYFMQPHPAGLEVRSLDRQVAGDRKSRPVHLEERAVVSRSGGTSANPPPDAADHVEFGAWAHGGVVSPHSKPHCPLLDSHQPSFRTHPNKVSRYREIAHSAG